MRRVDGKTCGDAGDEGQILARLESERDVDFLDSGVAHVILGSGIWTSDQLLLPCLLPSMIIGGPYFVIFISGRLRFHSAFPFLSLRCNSQQQQLVNFRRKQQRTASTEVVYIIHNTSAYACIYRWIDCFEYVCVYIYFQKMAEIELTSTRAQPGSTT